VTHTQKQTRRQLLLVLAKHCTSENDKFDFGGCQKLLFLHQFLLAAPMISHTLYVSYQITFGAQWLLVQYWHHHHFHLHLHIRRWIRRWWPQHYPAASVVAVVTTTQSCKFATRRPWLRRNNNNSNRKRSEKLNHCTTIRIATSLKFSFLWFPHPFSHQDMQYCTYCVLFASKLHLDLCITLPINSLKTQIWPNTETWDSLTDRFYRAGEIWLWQWTYICSFMPNYVLIGAFCCPC